MLGTIILALVGLLYFYIKTRYNYWKNRKVPTPEPQFLWGNQESPWSRTKPTGCLVSDIYLELKAQGHEHGGMYFFTRPIYVPLRPQHLKNIMQKDFQHFLNRELFCNEKDDPISAHLIALGGSKWRMLRTKLTPTFTSGKMKHMFETVVQCSAPIDGFLEETARSGRPVDAKYITSSYTVDVIGSCAFGLECNSFKHPNAEFHKWGMRIFQLSKLQIAKFLFCTYYPEVAHFLKLRIVDRDVSNFFMKAATDVIQHREGDNIERKDLLQTLIDYKNSAADHSTTLTNEEIAAQVFGFFAAGFETSSTTLTHCLFELSQHKDIQRKARQEIHATLKQNGGKLTYDSLMEMPYITQIIDETLRKWPSVPKIARICTKDYQLPNTDLLIEKGVTVYISVLGIHRDPEYYPDPEKFDPERFSKANKANMKPFTYIPFGEGPRICLGQRFGIMQIKVGLAALLKNHEFTLNKDYKLPPEIDMHDIVFAIKRPVLLDVRKVDATEL